MQPFTWRSESDDPRPHKLAIVDDRVTADTALRRVRRGEYLVYAGDFHNARQLLGAMGRRLERISSGRTPLEAFRSERKGRQQEHETLSRIVVTLDKNYALSMGRSPDVAEACRWVWGAPPDEDTLVPLKTLLGVLGAAEWRRKGLSVPGLEGALHPHYGVYLPTRTDYLELLLEVPRTEFAGKRIIECGTGTGVLSFLLLQRGAASVVATDLDSRALGCARDNAKLLGLAGQFQAVEADVFPDGRADWIVSNPPWIPEPPKNRMDRAVFDPASHFLERYLSELSAHLEPGGKALLFLSNLAVHLGLRPATWLAEQFEKHALDVTWTRITRARHAKAKDAKDPLHSARSREVTTLYCLTPKEG